MTALGFPQAAQAAASSRLAVTVGDAQQYGQDLRTFLDTIGTATGRATHYNTREEQVAAELKAHEAMFRYDRLLYGLLLTLAGNTDRAMQLGIVRLLADRQDGRAVNLADRMLIEERVIAHVLAALPVPRLFKMLVMLRQARVNNARTRRVIRTALLTQDNLELRAVRYRSKFGEALRHVLGPKLSGILRSITAKPVETWSDKEAAIFGREIARFAPEASADLLAAVVAFTLGWKQSPSGETDRLPPLFRQYLAARQDLKLGPDLPMETLVGLRGQFHKDLPKTVVLEMASRNQKTLTRGQRMAVQSAAEKAGVEIAFDPAQADAVKLYLYAFERGMTPEIETALETRAAEAAAGFPYRFDRVGLLVDASRSMAGSGEQKLRPMAVACATRDMLSRTGSESAVVYAGGRPDGRLVRPEGETALAEGLVAVLRQGVDIVYVVTDGYDNAPAGRFAETVGRIRDLGITIPIVQLSPVLAAESGGLRSLLGDGTAIPVSDPKALATSMVGPLLASDPVVVTKVLVETALGRLGCGLEVLSDG